MSIAIAGLTEDHSALNRYLAAAIRATGTRSRAKRIFGWPLDRQALKQESAAPPVMTQIGKRYDPAVEIHVRNYEPCT